MKPSKDVRIRIPEAAVAELTKVEEMDWSEGISLDHLLEWLNGQAARFRPDEIDAKARSSMKFTSRTFRHYQTQGIIDAPVRAGKTAMYGFRHYLQGLLLRKLLWERVPSEQIATLMSGRSNEGYKQLLFEGIEIVARGSERGDGVGRSVNEKGSQNRSWTRWEVGDGIEIHLANGRPEIKGKALENALARIREVIGRGT